MFFTPSFLFDFLIFITMVLIGVHLYIEKRHNHWQLIDPFNACLGVFAVIYIFEPIAYFDALRSAYGDGGMLLTQLWIIWAIIWLMVGYQLPFSRKLGNKLPSMPASLRPELLAGAGGVMIALGILGYLYTFASAGGIWNWLSVGRGGTNLEATTGYGVVLETFLPIGVILLLLRVELIPCATTYRVVVWSLSALQWLWFVYLGSRGRTILFLLTMAAIYYLPRRKSPPLVLAFVGAVFLFLLASFQAHYRGQFTGLSFHLNDLSVQEVKNNILPHSLGGMRGEDTGKSLGDLEYNCVAAVIDVVPSQVSFNYGFTLLELVTHGIPRAIWPNKVYPLYLAQTPVMRARELSRSWAYTPTTEFLKGPAFTYVGYWYHAGGGVALLLAGLFTGAMFRGIRCYLDRDPTSQGNLILYVLLLSIGFMDAASTPFYWLFSMPLSLIPVIIFLHWSRTDNAQPKLIPQLD